MSEMPETLHQKVKNFAKILVVPISTHLRALSAVSGTLLFKPRGFSQRLARQPAPRMSVVTYRCANRNSGKPFMYL